MWEAFLIICVSPYVGYRNCNSVDQVPQFQNYECKNLLQAAGIKFQPSVVGIHYALGVWECCHSVFRRRFNKITTDSSKLFGKEALSLSIKAINETVGPNGLVSTFLFSGLTSRLPIKPHRLLNQVARLKAMKEARDEAVKLIAQTRLATAITSNVFVAADSDIKISYVVLMFREKPVERWIGPFSVVDNDGMILNLGSGDLTWIPSVDKVKLYQEEHPNQQNFNGETDVTHDNSDYHQQIDAIFCSNERKLQDSSPTSIGKNLLKSLHLTTYRQRKTILISQKGKKSRVYKKGTYVGSLRIPK